MRKWCLGVVALLLAVGCASAGSGSGRSAPPPGTDLRRVTLTAAELHGIAAADSRLGAQLLAQLQASGTGNIALSPASIATALQMAYVGARGSTATEMATSLHVDGMTHTDVAAAAARLLGELAPLAHDKDQLLDVVNTVWAQSGFPLTPAYDAMMRTGFGAGLRRTDFRQSEHARQTINAAIAAATRDKIRDLIGSGQITPDTRLVLTNAVYLKARWDAPFEPSETQPRAFHRGDGSAVTVPTMAQTGELDYAHGPGYQAVRLPYAGNRLAMTVVVPTGRDAGYPAHIGPFRPAAVDLWLPKFRFSWSRDLTTALQALGLRTAFTDSADFTGITTAESLHLSFVQHQAFIDVNENGTEAAAATAVGIAGTGAFAPRTLVPVHADHPFYFAITDAQTGLVLFLGHIADPTAS